MSYSSQKIFPFFFVALYPFFLSFLQEEVISLSMWEAKKQGKRHVKAFNASPLLSCHLFFFLYFRCFLPYSFLTYCIFQHKNTHAKLNSCTPIGIRSMTCWSTHFSRYLPTLALYWTRLSRAARFFQTSLDPFSHDLST